MLQSTWLQAPEVDIFEVEKLVPFFVFGFKARLLKSQADVKDLLLLENFLDCQVPPFDCNGV